MAVIDDTWTWRQLSPATVPDARIGHTMVMANDRIIMFGGVVVGPGAVDEVWEYYADDWHLVTPSGDWPTARAYHTAVWTGSEMIMTGGFTNPDQFQYLPDTWSYVPGSGWTEFTTAHYPDGNDAVFFHGTDFRTMVWDTINDRCLLLVNHISPDGLQTWGFDLSDWTHLTPSVEWGAEIGAVHPFPREYIASAWAADRMVTIGGTITISDVGSSNDVHELPEDLSGWNLTQAQVTFNTFPTAAGVIENAGARPAAWTGDQVFIYGGSWIHSSSTPTNTTDREFVYTPGVPTIAELTSPISGRPPARCYHAFVFDGRRILMFGGQSGFSGGTIYDETWVLEPPPQPVEAHVNVSFGLGR